MTEHQRPALADPSDRHPEDPGMDGALAAFRWLQATAVERPEGLVWKPDPSASRASGEDDLDLSLYHGVPGVALFLGELARAIGDEGTHRAGAAERVADAARETQRALLAHVGDPELAPGLYTGVAGIGAALLALDRALGDPDGRLERGVVRCLERLAAQARRSDTGTEWNDSTDVVSGSAGIGFFLLAAAARLHDAEPTSAETALELAREAGDSLLERAIAETNGRTATGGLRWAMSPDFPRNMPNFSHGTAGVSTFLAQLHGATGDTRFLDGALAGARYLTAIAETTGDVCLIEHHDPGGEDLYYLSWCHGPAGTARLFYVLWQATGDQAWSDWMERSARAILRSGIPERRTPGFWNNVGQCCGSAGVLDFFLSLFRATGNRDYLAFAERLATQIIERAEADRGGWRWTQAEHRVQPDLLVAQTGYMQGAAGIGTALLRLHLVRAGRDLASRLPDAPF